MGKTPHTTTKKKNKNTKKACQEKKNFGAKDRTRKRYTNKMKYQVIELHEEGEVIG